MSAWKTKFVATVLVTLSFSPFVLANRTGMTRTEIRTIPIHERPNRAGHFYGNTVRRNASRR